MPEERRKRRKKKKTRRARPAEEEWDEERPLPIEHGESEFANAASVNADNEPVVAVADDDEPAVLDADVDDSERQQVDLLGPSQDYEEAVPSPIGEPDADDGLAIGEEQGGFTEDGLAVATAVDASAEDDFIYAAIEYDPDSKPPLHKNRRFRVYTCLALVVVIAVVTAVVVYSAKGAKGVDVTDLEMMVNGAPSAGPTFAPTTDREASGIREQVEAGILQRGANFTGMDEGDPRSRALDWILHYDRLQLDSDDVNLYQRYVLALLAFSFDSLAWHHCGEHRKVSNVTEFFAEEDCEVQNRGTTQTEAHKVWLSSTEECQWYGVICSADEVVRGVELMGNDLIGEIPPEISQLRFLQYLALNGNCLFGEIPPELGRMPNLLSLELQGNGLSGALPDELYDASKLQLLNVAMQYQYSSVCYMSNGTYVNTLFERGGVYSRGYNMGLSGPVLEENVVRWSSMKGLHLFDNSFNGTIAEVIGELKYLVFLRAQNNMFESYLPYGLEKLKKLREVYLSKNALYLNIPPRIGQMEDLEDLRLDENEMTGVIPDSLYSLRKLKRLWLQDTVLCEQVAATALKPGGYECAASPDVGFNGTIATEIGNLKKLSQLLINNNPFDGTVPTEIGLCENLSVLHIHKTNIDGSAPGDLCRLRDKKLNNEANVGVFYADCRPNNRTEDPFFACDCCTDCCDHTTKVCIADD